MESPLHERLVVVDSLIIAKWGPDFFKGLRTGGLTAINATCAVWENFRETMENIAEWHRWFDRHSDIIMPICTTADIHAAKSAGKTGIILGFQNASPIEDRIEFLRLFRALGVGVIQLTYNNQNFVGSGCYETSDSGLTDFGRDVVEEMNACGTAIDLSHVGPRTSRNAIAHSKKPVCFSHANPQVLKDHVRNKDDDLLRALAAKQGYVGINLYPPFMPDDANTRLEHMIPMLDHLINVVGEDHVGIGTDMTQGQDPKFWHYLTHIHGGEHVIFDIRGKIGQPTILTDIAEYAIITETLERAGYTEGRIEKIMGRNVIDFLKEAWNEN